MALLCGWRLTKTCLLSNNQLILISLAAILIRSPPPALCGNPSIPLQAHCCTSQRRRTNPVMFNVAHSLSPSMLAALADHFHALNPPPAGSGPQRLAAGGKTIYKEGIPEANIAACFACHGLEGRGQDETPRLAGQLYPYVVKALTSWTGSAAKARGNPTQSASMAPTAHNLTQSQIAAVAAYVSHLK
jgi:cytochrome c553